MPEASLDMSLHFLYRYCTKLAAHEEPPKSELHLLPSRGEERSQVEPDKVVGKPSGTGWSRRKIASIRR
jgi:hypothetical protein